MAYLRWRRFTELLSLDNPALGELFMRKRGKPIVAASVEKWDAEYQAGVYDRLSRSEQRHHHRLLAAMIADRWPNPRVLEIGAGEGVFYEALRPHRPARYVGVDFSKPAIERGETRLAPEIAIGEVKMLLGDGRDFQTDETFDVVVFSECIEHLGEVEDLVAHYRPNLKAGGAVGLTMWLALKPLRLWHRLKAMGEVLDEAVINTPWGGGWLVAVVEPRAAVE
jgi:cyclopropane fatty-acyl-phospholipid synthase-like methyltransferase